METAAPVAPWSCRTCQALPTRAARIGSVACRPATYLSIGPLPGHGAKPLGTSLDFKPASATRVWGEGDADGLGDDEPTIWQPVSSPTNATTAQSRHTKAAV